MKRIDGKNTKSNPELNKKEKEIIYNEYFKNLELWSKLAKKAINIPIVSEDGVLDLRKLSSKQKKFIVSNHDFMDFLFMRSRIGLRTESHKDIHRKKYNFKYRLCAGYTGFIATLAKLLDPKNDVVIYFGTATVIEAINKEEINKSTEHFWVTINGELFDNSNVDKCAYTNYEPVFKIQDIISGSFNLESI